MSRKARTRLQASTLSPLPGTPEDESRSVSRSRASPRAASRVASRANSRAPSVNGSAPGSRVASRNHSPVGSSSSRGDTPSDGSDMEDDEDLELGSGVDWLLEKMEDRDFMRGASEDRANILRTYANRLCLNQVDDPGAVDEAVPILLKCLSKDSGDSMKHTLRALGASAVISDGPTRLYERVKEPVRLSIYDGNTTELKTTALHTYGMLTYFGARETSQVSSAMAFFLEIIKSDGDSLDCIDNGDVVAAAIEEWSFLSTLIEADPLIYNEALECFEDQLESTSSAVLLAAADSIGLLAEQQYEPRELDRYGWPLDESNLEPLTATEQEQEQSLAVKYRARSWQQLHDFFEGRESIVKAVLKTLSTSTMRKTKKDVRREIHSVARDVLHTVEHPWRGPRFSTALADGEETRMLAHRMIKAGVLIDRWWKLHRYNALKRVLGGGLQTFMAENESVGEMLGNALLAPSRFRVKAEDDDGDGVEDITGRFDEIDMAKT
jgi:hypothetical protein